MNTTNILPTRTARAENFVKARFKTLPQLLEAHKAIERVHRTYGRKAKCMSITGFSYTGKTECCRSYLKRYPQQDADTGTVTPVLYVRFFKKMKPSDIVTLLFDALGVSFSGKETDRELALYKLLKRSGVTLVMCDEVQHVLPEHGEKTVQQVADFFKTFLEKTNIPLVFVGLPKLERLFAEFPLSASSAKSSKANRTKHKEEDQLKHRAYVGYVFQPIAADSQEWDTLIEKYQKALPEDKKLFESKQMRKRLWLASHGRIGRLANLIEAALCDLEDDALLSIEGLSDAYYYVATWEKTRAINPFDLNLSKPEWDTHRSRIEREMLRDD
ncbi:hypothetical protein K08M3_40610 [Vibrio alginolyticus]|uniref:AAA+ ATPase domain-containing protein n=1 Tax=Vibrio alginolyticus TaxID=663 RepID=A0A1W6UCT1_VIBAL|nr:ATP-binding protein [Vibrio alginolyticus]ARP00901.1 hypothetical protein K01M1_40760 [Vibrio alginolyticus]ARP05601.1 hypothetical protein K04M1_40690 [Vibrio alginolyticus]ARP10659.1 hypothetical protein K04M3_40710 [Vibrio alginolyticus]ARP15758.1 hypothetical protein K04M5_40970 [Vibrio alginolyticus]ARP20812.1 hypothetical protein K05K4_40920 [Vibrio alginolyticus]